jgi:hypothetical protein
MISETLIIFLTSVMSLNSIPEKSKKELENNQQQTGKARSEQQHPIINNQKGGGGWDYN